jgi:hypothetical protein
MKNLIKIFLLFFFLTQPASASYQVDVKLAQENKSLLSALKRTCLDSWCEGYYQLQFQNVVFIPRTNSTQVFFRMSHEGDRIRLSSAEDPSFEGQINAQYNDVFCTVKGFSDQQSILKSPSTLQPEFFKSLDTCVEALQTRLIKVRFP